MNKKVFTIITIVALITLISGCSKNNDIQISTLKFSNNKVSGEVRNLSNNRYKVNLNFLFTNGSIKEKESCEIIVEAKEKSTFSCSVYGINNDYNVSIDSYDLLKMKDDETFRDETALDNYEEINNIVNQYIKNGVLKYEDFSKYVFDNITIKYEGLSDTDHYYNVQYSAEIGININLYFNKKMELEEFRLSKSSDSITKSEKKIILSILNITENDFDNTDLETYKTFLKNDNYDDYPYLYDIIGNTEYKGVTFNTNKEKGITITDYKSTYLGLHYELSIKYN